MLPSPERAGDDGLLAVNASGVEASLEQVLARLSPSPRRPLVVGAVADYRIALTAVHAGAADYYALPQDLDLLRGWLREESARLKSVGQAARFATHEAGKYRFDAIIGESPALRDTLDRAARVIRHPGVTVLVTGETGTGKELLARVIHYNGPRRQAPFVDVNCAAMPEALLEGELFGHEAGGWSSATAAKPGLFEMAHAGTIFLDEVGQLTPPLQGKLLQVLEQREIRRLGSSRPIAVNVRVIAATQVDLAAAVRQGEFRQDLFYRLNVVGLHLPPLRDRAGDLLPLIRHFVARFARQYGLPIPEVTSAAERRLLQHPWTGNIRELRQVLERAVLLSQGMRLDLGNLGLQPTPPVICTDGIPFPARLADIIHSAAHAMTRLCDGNRSEAARRLGISRTRLLRLLAPGTRAAAPEGAGS
jgi:two-component system response regulator HydG